jgi:hypothetical protein
MKLLKRKPKNKKVIKEYGFAQCNMDGKFIRGYENEFTLKHSGYNIRKVYKVCNGKEESYKGYKWIKMQKINGLLVKE